MNDIFLVFLYPQNHTNMKALVKRYAKPGIWLEEVPMPEVGLNDVLIKVKKAAICGTDLHMYKWDVIYK